MGGQDRKSAGFVKSVIKAFSVSRFRSPDGSTRASPTIEQLDVEKPSEREQYSDEVENHGSHDMESVVKRGYSDEFRSLPITVSEKEIRYMNVSSAISGKKNKSSLFLSQAQEERPARPLTAPSHGESLVQDDRSERGRVSPSSPEPPLLASRGERDVKWVNLGADY
jgi:hypothetical protein